MNSPTRGMWVCRHGVDGRDWCPECYATAEEVAAEVTSPEVSEIPPRIREIFHEVMEEVGPPPPPEEDG